MSSISVFFGETGCGVFFGGLVVEVNMTGIGVLMVSSLSSNSVTG